jgi:hypothetical protein
VAYDFKLYRRPAGSTTGVLIASYSITEADATAAIIAAERFMGEIHPGTDFAVLRDSKGEYVRRWGIDAPRT